MNVVQQSGEPGAARTGRPEKIYRHEKYMRGDIKGARVSAGPFNGRRRVPEGQVVEGVKKPGAAHSGRR